MPQMAPMNWLILFIMFIIILMIFNSMNYFSFFYKSPPLKLNFNIIQNNWKW